MTRREDEEPRTERPLATTWLLLPSDVLTVARCAVNPQTPSLPIGSHPTYAAAL